MISSDDDLGSQEMLTSRENKAVSESQLLITTTNSEAQVKIKDSSSVKNDAGGNPETHRTKLWLTLWMLCSFVALGLCSAQIGPSLLDLLSLTNSNLAEGSAVITIGSIGDLCGAMCTGLFLQSFSNKFLTLVSLLGSAVFNIMMTWCPNLILLILVNFIRNIFTATLNTVVYALCVEIWRKDTGPYMQAVHLGYALGALGAPLIVKPFLRPMQTTSTHSIATVNQTTNSSSSSSNITVSIFSAMNSSLFQTTEFLPNLSISNSNLSKPTNIPKTQIHYAYLILSIITILTAFPFGFYVFKSGAYREAEKIKDQEKDMSLKWKETIIPLLMILLLFMTYCALENTISIYLMTFTVKYLNWTKQDGSMATFVFWLCFACGGFLRIFMPKVLTVNQMLLVDLSLLNISSFVLLRSKSLPILVWIFFGLSGFAMAGIYPTGFTWFETYLYKVTTQISSAISIFASLGISLNPLFLGFMMENYSPRWFLFILSGESLACLCLFLGLVFFSKSQYWQNKRKLIEDTNICSCTEKLE